MLRIQPPTVTSLSRYVLKDDKSYPYIRVTVQEDYPRILFCRQVKRDKSKYFGPYTSAGAVKDTIELMRKVYKIRSCSRSLPKEIGKDRPCLYYQINQCDAPCQNYISREEYRKYVDKALKFLNGDEKEIINNLEDKMKKAAAELEFEQAAEYRDLIENVKRIGEKQKINDTGGDDRDIIALAKAGDEAVVAIFFIRSGKLLGRDHFHMTGIGDSEKQEILTDFIKQFYVGTPFIPKEILTQEDVLDKEILEKWLSDKRGSKVNFAMPKRGSKHQMMELARKNAQNVLIQDSEKLKREEHRTIGAVHELEQLLGIENLNRMEAFDISNTNGYENVASMVVFEKGKAKRSDYRKFKIRTVAGPDDYRCMEEALERRFSHGIREQKEREEKGQDISFGSFTRFPDILMMDGGKGQVNIAVKVLEKMGLNIPVCGMVKDDFHRTRGLYYQNEIIDFPKNSEAFRMVTRLQDEAHRFAITYHKALRGKEQVHSVLDDIKGIGSIFGLLLFSSTYCGNVIDALNRSPSTLMSNTPPIKTVRLFAMESPRPLPSVVLDESPRIKRSVRSPALLFSLARECSDTFLMEKTTFSSTYAISTYTLVFSSAYFATLL